MSDVVNKADGKTPDRHPDLRGRHRRVPDPAGHRRRLEHRPVDPHPADRASPRSTTASSTPRRRSRRSPTSTASRASSATAATRSSSSPSTRTYLEVAWLLIYGELPTRRRAGRVRREDPPPHAPARGPQALLLGAAAHGAPDVGALERRRRRSRPTTRTSPTRTTSSTSSSPRSACSRSSRSSRPTRTRRASGRRSSTPTTR